MIKIKSDIDQIDLKNPIQKTLVQAATTVQRSAKRNAPVLTWTLRRSISTDLAEVKNDIAKVWTNVPYAKLREYENRKNPRRRFYMRRSVNQNIDKIKQLFLKNLLK